MTRDELMDLVQDYGSPVDAAIVTGRAEEMIVCYEGMIQEDFNFVQNLVGDERDELTVALYNDGIVRTREVIEKLKLIKRGLEV